MFELLATVDPFAALLGSLWLFAAGMFPLGFMLGSSCSACCGRQCNHCTGTLPETLTVALSGIPETTKGPDLATLSFSSCYGSGASGAVTAPGQSAVGSNVANDRGPITAVSLTSGGSGYAKLGRTAPTVTVTGTSGSGSGATFNVTLASSKDSCGIDRWAVSKVTAAGGSGYKTGDTLTFAIADGDTQEDAASATLYAARIAPTVTVTGTSGSGTGATFDVTLAQSQDSSGLDRWAVSKVTRTGGDGYANGDTLTFAIANGDTQEVAATAKIAGTTYAEPTLSLSVPGGTGAVLEIDGYTVSGDYWGGYDFGDTWRISGITVANGGTGYTNDTLVTVNLGPNDQARPFAGSNLRVRTGFRAPADDWSLEDGSVPQTGDGLILSLTMEVSPTSATTWRVGSWVIIDGGSGYGVGQRIRPAAIEGNNHPQPLRANLQITAVDSGGAVTAIDLFGTTTSTRNTSRGRYSIDNGVITSVENLFSQAGWRKVITNPDGVIVTNGGVYYREDENSRTVTVNSGGRYYREDASLPPYVATITVGINQTAPSQGSGASISATVGSDPGNAETFGKITGLTINNGGTGYLAHELFPSCLGRFNGRSIVVKRAQQISEIIPNCVSAAGCCYSYQCSQDYCRLETEAVRVDLRQQFDAPEGLPLVVSLHVRGGHNATGSLAAEVIAPHCPSIDVTAYGIPLGWPYPEIFLNLPPEATAHVTAGGTYEELEACKKITHEDMDSLYGELSWGGMSATIVAGGCGPDSGWSFRGPSHPFAESTDATGEWCEQWKATIGDEWKQYPFSIACGESRFFSPPDVASSIQPKEYCQWKWRGSTLVVSILREFNILIGIGVYGQAYRRCSWAYPVSVVIDDETSMPTGVQLGSPVFSSERASNIDYLGFGNLLDESTVCQNPGPPTITLSSLP